MKELRIQVSKCFNCPYYRTPHDDKVRLNWCYLAGKLIDINFNIIDMPDWCPLEEEANGKT